jgi:excisionase family DNA binding protein
MKNNPEGQIAFSIADAVANSTASRSEIYRALQRGELRAKKLGKRTIILRDDFAAYLAALPDYSVAA